MLKFSISFNKFKIKIIYKSNSHKNNNSNNKNNNKNNNEAIKNLKKTNC